MGWVIGPDTGVGNDMAQCIIKSNRYVVPRQTLPPLHIDELHSPEEQNKRNMFGDYI